MIDFDKRIRITKSVSVGSKDGNQVFYIEGSYPKDTRDPVVLPTVGVATGSILTEVETGNVMQFSEASSDWVLQFSIQS